MLADDKRPFTTAAPEGRPDEHRSAPLPLVFGDYALEDRYRLDKGRVYLTGIQALVRLPMMQRQRDLAAGPQHRRLHLGLSRLAARHVRQRAVGREAAT